MKVGSVRMAKFCYGSHQYTDNAFTGPTIYGLLEGMRHGSISLHLFVDNNGLLVMLVVINLDTRNITVGCSREREQAIVPLLYVLIPRNKCLLIIMLYEMLWSSPPPSPTPRALAYQTGSSGVAPTFFSPPTARLQLCQRRPLHFAPIPHASTFSLCNACHQHPTTFHFPRSFFKTKSLTTFSYITVSLSAMS